MEIGVGEGGGEGGLVYRLGLVVSSKGKFVI